MKSPTMMWDFWSLNPEFASGIDINDRGTPYGYRHMNGYGSHTYSMLDKANQRIYVSFISKQCRESGILPMRRRHK
jgi:catalase